ncbi:MAG: PEGA domain-containing protein [Terriglobales bacterium]
MRRALVVITLLAFSAIAAGKDNPIVMFWPGSDKPALKLTFSRFQGIAVIAGQSTFVSDVLIENLTDKPVLRIYFTVYVKDKSNVRIGDGVLTVNDVPPSQLVKTRLQISCVGTPVSLDLSARKDMLVQPGPKMVPLKVLSNPSGASLKVDGQDAGVTPVMVRLTAGTHALVLTNEGYAPGNAPVEITPDELPGGSITIDLGGLSRDTLELRDGTVILGDLISMTLTSVVVRVDGNDKTYDRNQVKKIMLVERVTTIQQPMAAQPAPAKPN